MDIFKKICQFLQDKGIVVRRHIELEQYTTPRIGGEAQILAEPSSITQIQQYLVVCKQHRTEWFLFGNDSNVLTMDEGSQGMVIVLATNFNNIRPEKENRVRVQSGAAIKAVGVSCAAHSLSDLEFVCGIPGSVGGTVFMSTGTYDGEIKDVSLKVIWLDENGSLHASYVAQLELSYRHSRFSGHEGIMLEAVYALVPGRQEVTLAQMEELTRRQKGKQPLDAYSAGSTFERPRENYASVLIRDARLMGTEVHDTQVSVKRVGFLINRGAAGSQDFPELIHEIQQEVKEHSGYELEYEIRFLRNEHRS